MERFEKFIHSHRDEIDVYEPPDGHLERFRERLKLTKPSQSINLFLVGAAAAVAGIIMTAGLSLLLNHGNFSPTKKINNEMLLSNLSPEIIQIDDYYRYRVNQKQEVITQMLCSKDLAMEQEINNTLAELDKGYLRLKHDISESPRSERSAYVLTLFYQAQLEALEQILSKLQSVNVSN